MPGNHDVQRREAENARISLLELGRANQKGLSDWMAGMGLPFGAQESWRDAIGKRTAEFWKWVETDLQRPELLPSNNRHRRLGYQAKVKGLNLPFDVHIFGLDSAWLAGDNNDARKLRLTQGQLDLLTRDAEGRIIEGFRLTLVHHPLADLSDEPLSYRLLAKTTDLLLHGHQHDPIAEIKMDVDRSLRVLAAGSLYEGDDGDHWINGFNIVDAFLDDTGRPTLYRVTFWAWSERGHWHRSGAVYEEAVDGVLEIPVGPQRPTEDAVSNALFLAKGPPAIWYFVSRNQHRDAILKHLFAVGGSIGVVGMPGRREVGADCRPDSRPCCHSGISRRNPLGHDWR